MFRLIIFSCLFLATFANSNDLPKRTEQRIVGGYNTSITEVPYAVSVQEGYRHMCGGSIVGQKHVLTAAHCVEGKDVSQLTVRAGTNHPFTGGEVAEVSEVKFHPNYTNITNDYDAAVLILKNSLTGGERVRIATLGYVEPKTGDMVQISGWGSTEKGKDLNPAYFLQSASVPVVSQESCKEKHKGKRTITDRMFCAGFLKGGQDSCKGDSGGPAENAGYLAGIMLWDGGCGDPELPGIYTSIYGISGWISSLIQE